MPLGTVLFGTNVPLGTVLFGTNESNGTVQGSECAAFRDPDRREGRAEGRDVPKGTLKWHERGEWMMP